MYDHTLHVEKKVFSLLFASFYPRKKYQNVILMIALKLMVSK